MSRDCLNMQREHNSNHIYFIISEKTIIQKCFSPWKNLKGEECRKFKSKPMNINKKLKDILFNEPIEEEEVPKLISKKRRRIFSIDD